MKTAHNFVKDGPDKWMTLKELADVCNIHPSGELHNALVDVELLRQIAKRIFPHDERMYAYVEDIQLS